MVVLAVLIEIMIMSGSYPTVSDNAPRMHGHLKVLTKQLMMHYDAKNDKCEVLL